MCIYIYIYTHILHMCMYIYIYIHTCTHNTYIYIYIYICIYITDIYIYIMYSHFPVGAQVTRSAGRSAYQGKPHILYVEVFILYMFHILLGWLETRLAQITLNYIELARILGSEIHISGKAGYWPQRDLGCRLLVCTITYNIHTYNVRNQYVIFRAT